jgi:hypothetical protein
MPAIPFSTSMMISTHANRNMYYGPFFFKYLGQLKYFWKSVPAKNHVIYYNIFSFDVYIARWVQQRTYFLMRSRC